MKGYEFDVINVDLGLGETLNTIEDKTVESSNGGRDGKGDLQPGVGRERGDAQETVGKGGLEGGEGGGHQTNVEKLGTLGSTIDPELNRLVLFIG